MALTEKLTNIANAIREKGGTTDALTLEGMVEAIAAIETGGGGYYIPEEAFHLTGDVAYRFSTSRNLQWLADYHMDKLSTSDITRAYGMFEAYISDVPEIPFDFNFKEGTGIESNYMFYECHGITKIGKFINWKPTSTQNMFYGCHKLKEIPEMINADFSQLQKGTGNIAGMFNNCRSIRHIPEELTRNLYNSSSTYYYVITSNLCPYCYALEEYRGLWVSDGAVSMSVLNNTFGQCYRIKEITFATNEDGTAKVAKLAGQTFDLVNYIGYANSASNITGYNSGLTEETRIKDAATYELYKNHPDSWTTDAKYSRYNHDSAVITINSLPDTTEYCASMGKTNIIRFSGNAGSATDGGAINTLTEEEIAVATAKGWTVSFV